MSPTEIEQGFNYACLLENNAEARVLINKEQMALATLPVHIALDDEIRQFRYLFESDEEHARPKVDIWLLPKPQMKALLSADTILSSQDKQLAETISHEATRNRHLAMRILSRIALSSFTENQVAVAEWEFIINPFGKPEINSPRSDICFNISHSEDVSVVAVGDCASIGVDIEMLSPEGLLELPLHVLSEAEKQQLAVLEGVEKYQQFIKYWTLKEAFAKAEGKGFSIDFDKLEVTLSPLALSFLSEAKGEQPNLRSALFKFMTVMRQGQTYKLAVCLQS